MTSIISQMEAKLYDSDKWAWAVYTALRHAPNKGAKVVLWALLDNDQQAALRVIAKASPGNPPREAAQPPGPAPTGPTHDKYGVKL